MTTASTTSQPAAEKTSSDQGPDKQKEKDGDPGYLAELADDVVPDTRDEAAVLRKQKP